MDVLIGNGDGARLTAHELRAEILGEVHARPFTAIETPRRILHFVFDTSANRAEKDRAAFAEFCAKCGQFAPKPSDKYHRVILGTTTLRWEQHTEFTTYTWEMPTEGTAEDQPLFYLSVASLARPMVGLPQPGPLLAAIDLQLCKDNERVVLDRLFDRSSLVASGNSDGKALYATDFRVDPNGFVRILVVDRGLDADRAGALVQRVLEIETYRTLALLGPPEAHRLAPAINLIEARLAELTEEMPRARDFADNRRLLTELTSLAAEMESAAGSSLNRFGASRAYDESMQIRLKALGEQKIGGLPTWSSFLARRMAPALRFCATMESRQTNLSRKLERAAHLLRTIVDVEMQQQNRDLLASMNDRAQLQMRLQTTVEGLSVAAISYYLVGLFAYLVKGAHEAGFGIDPDHATAWFVPIAVLIMGLTVSRIRRRQSKHLS
jgi:uncharacterized membrane-anchored protein